MTRPSRQRQENQHLNPISDYHAAMKLMAVVVFVGLLTACQQEDVRPKHKPRASTETRLVHTIQLPNDDGRVYVIESPADDYGLEVNSCMLHIKGGASTTACTPPKMKFLDAPE